LVFVQREYIAFRPSYQAKTLGYGRLYVIIRFNDWRNAVQTKGRIMEPSKSCREVHVGPRVAACIGLVLAGICFVLAIVCARMALTGYNAQGLFIVTGILVGTALAILIGALIIMLAEQWGYNSAAT
jgi:hypothetical protein